MRNYLVVLFRNLAREKLYATINIVGLALGLASCLILGLYLKSELTYDRHFSGHQHIYRLMVEFTATGTTTRNAITPEGLGPMLAAEYPDRIQGYVRLRNNANDGGVAMRRTDQTEQVYYWEDSYFADQNVFDVFKMKIIAGDPKTALVDGASIAISERFAKRYFGAENPIGRTMATDSGNVNKVTLVFADLPANTHLKFDLLFSYNQPFLQLNDNPTVRRMQLGNMPTITYTYLVMPPSFRPTDWQRMSEDFVQKYMADYLAAASIQWRSLLQPLREVHLAGPAGFDRPGGNRAYLFGCAAVALIILVIACINYMNLATARAARRARSVGFRKILGANRFTLALGFLGEALLFALLALVLAVVIVEVVLRFTPINTLMDGKVGFNLVEQPLLGLGLLGGALGIGLLSGLYPAVYLSSWAPLTALAGGQPVRKGSLHLREFLVLVQFTISAAAIACTLLMVAQMHYVANQPLGFQRDNRLMVSLRGAPTIEKIPAIRNALLADSRIRGVAVASQTPEAGDRRAGGGQVAIQTEAGNMDKLLTGMMQIGEDYEQVMGLKIVEGRDLSTHLLTDLGTNMLVNQTLVKKMGWTEPLGKRIQDGYVVGVVSDFNFKSLKFNIDPLVITKLSSDMSKVAEMNRPFQQRHLILDLTGSEIPAVLAHVGKVLADADPRHPFEYRFLDEALDRQYRSEHALTRLIGLFAGISIFIACMGLFGLAAFTTEQRTREIGIRKVLGASAGQIVTLLARRILLLVLAAAVLASIAAYFAMDEWLAGFAYRARINPLVFLLSALLAAAVAFTTVAAQSWRTASADPVDAMRHE